MNEELIAILKKRLAGDVHTDKETLEQNARDTSLFYVKPEVVVYPKHTQDVKELVRFVSENKAKFPKLSITGRSGGTDMSGGAINESIIVSFTKYMHYDSVNIDKLTATVEPGVFYRDFEKDTLPKHVYMPAYPASKSICALGGMIMNNSGGEQTLRYGQMRNFVRELHVVLSDGNEYIFKKLNREELDEKKALQTFEGSIYRKMYDLLENNFDIIKKAEPKTAKNSSGYALWKVWDRKYFDLTQLFVGSQGTLGIFTKAQILLVKEKPKKKLIVLFFKDWDILPEIVNALLPFEPESLETFDDETLKLGLRFMPEIAKKAGKGLLAFALQFLPEVLIGIKMLGLPKLIVLVQIVEDTEEVLEEKVSAIKKAVSHFPLHYRVMKDEDEAQKYWIMRRESFALLRKHVSGKRTAPFIDDFCVLPEDIPEFLPQMLAILKEYGIKANIAGHAGSGNLHIIPLMDMKKKSEREKIPIVAEKVYDLILKYGGTITAEHNDGIIRTPYLEKMYGKEVNELFKKTKEIFDPQNIFNPGKKVGGTVEYMVAHISGK